MCSGHAVRLACTCGHMHPLAPLLSSVSSDDDAPPESKPHFGCAAFLRLLACTCTLASGEMSAFQVAPLLVSWDFGGLQIIQHRVTRLLIRILRAMTIRLHACICSTQLHASRIYCINFPIQRCKRTPLGSSVIGRGVVWALLVLLWRASKGSLMAYPFRLTVA
jgi:hypothetical protein